MFFVYILKSLKDNSYYVGETADIRKRLSEHNNGSAHYSATKRPYILVWYCAFPSKTSALIFERYLKSGSGFAFRNKHLLNMRP
jgi:putative endonuclease